MKKLFFAFITVVVMLCASHTVLFANYIDLLMKGEYEQALAEMKPLAMKGDAKAQYDYALMYETGLVVPMNDEKAAEWYRKSADQGYPYAFNNLGVMYDEGRGVARDEKKAAECFMQAAAKGLDKSQYSLALMYAEGRGVPKDMVRAYAWYSLAASQKNKQASAKLKELEPGMTRIQIEKAKKLADELKPKNPVP